MTSPIVQAPKQLMQRLFTRPSAHQQSGSIVGWWEARRVPYNFIVGAVGVVTSAVMVTVALTCESRGGAPIGLPDPPLFAVVGVLLYAIFANICYTGGWITELLVAKLWHADTSRFGPIAFALGTGFSVIITLLPAGLVIAVATITSCRGF
jgi:hypothetical protein